MESAKYRGINEKYIIFLLHGGFHLHLGRVLWLRVSSLRSTRSAKCVLSPRVLLKCRNLTNTFSY